MGVVAAYGDLIEVGRECQKIRRESTGIHKSVGYNLVVIIMAVVLPD